MSDEEGEVALVPLSGSRKRPAEVEDDLTEIDDDVEAIPVPPKKKNRKERNETSEAPKIQPNPIEFRTKHLNQFRCLIGAIKDLTKEANFSFNEKGVWADGLDDNRVSMVIMLFRSSAFEIYTRLRDVTIGISVPTLYKILCMGGKDGILTFRINHNQDTVTLILESLRGDDVIEFTMKLLDIDTESLTPPNGRSPSIVMPSSKFQEIVKKSFSVGETICFSCSKHGGSFSTPGDMTTSRFFITPSVQDNIEFNFLSSKFENSFSLKILEKFTVGALVSPTCEIFLEQDAPASFKFEADFAMVTYYLAPKIAEP